MRSTDWSGETPAQGLEAALIPGSATAGFGLQPAQQSP